MIWEKTLLIRESHLDTFGHVNNAAYLTIFEEARWDIITANGFGMDKISELQIGPTILEIRLRFKKELRLRQTVKIKSESLPYSGKIGIIRQVIVNEKGEVCCEGEFKVGLFDLRARRLVEPTGEWQRALGKSSDSI